MSKGLSGLFTGTTDSPQLTLDMEDNSGTNYNSANSKSVKTVTNVIRLNNVHSMPPHSNANSVSQNISNGKITTERYYDNNGDAYLDIDYTNHGNPKMHPIVPHEHDITFENGKLKREKVGRQVR